MLYIYAANFQLPVLGENPKTLTKFGTIQRRLAWPLRKDDTHISRKRSIFSSFGSGVLYVLYMPQFHNVEQTAFGIWCGILWMQGMGQPLAASQVKAHACVGYEESAACGTYLCVWQPAAKGHRAYTDLSAARVNWEMTHMQPSEPKPLLTRMLRVLLLQTIQKSRRISAEAPSMGVSGMATAACGVFAMTVRCMDFLYILKCTSHLTGGSSVSQAIRPSASSPRHHCTPASVCIAIGFPVN